MLPKPPKVQIFSLPLEASDSLEPRIPRMEGGLGADVLSADGRATTQLSRLGDPSLGFSFEECPTVFMFF